MTKIVDVLAQINQGVGSHVVSIGLVLDNGQIGWGDCVDLENDGDLLSSMITRYVKPLLTGRVLGSFRELSAEIDAPASVAPFAHVSTKITLSITFGS